MPSGVVGITIRLSVSNNGTSVMFSSNVIQTPNEAVHDLQLTTSSWEDGFLNISLLSPQGRQDRMFLCIESIRGNSSVQISAEEGDTSTGSMIAMVVSSNFLHFIFRAGYEYRSIAVSHYNVRRKSCSGM